MGDGLPTGEDVFHHEIWGIGRELARAPNGALIAISRDHGQGFRWDAANKRWAAARLALHGQPNEVVAAANTFFVAVNGDGVYRSSDGGASWAKVWSGDADHIAVDAAHPNRLAAGTADGVILSRDGGRTWAQQDRRLPYRVGNVVAFAGDRLLAGSGGNGAFWMPIPEAR